MGVLRFILALSVCVSHSSNGIGDYGFFQQHASVMLFFVVSGFYMGYVYNDYQYSKIDFYLNRAVRLVPLYMFVLLFQLTLWRFSPISLGESIAVGYTAIAVIFVLLCIAFIVIMRAPAYEAIEMSPIVKKVIPVVVGCMVFGWGLYLHFTSTEEFNISLFYYLIPQFLMIGADIVYFFGATGVVQAGLYIAPIWSVGIEMQYYMLTPFIYRYRVFIVLFLIAASLAWRSLYVGVPGSFFIIYSTIPSVICFFLLGHLSFLLCRHVRTLWFSRHIGWAIIIFGGVYFLFEISHVKAANMFWRWDWFASGNYEDYSTYIPFALMLPFLFIVSWKSKADRMIGELSYPLYISHTLIVSLMIQRNGWDVVSTPTEDVILVVSSVVFAILLRVIVEKSIDPLRERIRGFQR